MPESCRVVKSWDGRQVVIIGMNDNTGLSTAASASEEPKQAFHCLPPDERIRQRYSWIFARSEPLPDRALKVAFDKTLALLGLVLTSPLFMLLLAAYALEGLLIRDSRGPPIVYYWAMSAGQKIPKYKFRTVKMGCIDEEAARRGDWHAYAREWTPASLTYVGRFVKKTYLDELPQLWSILRGDMSFVGPRPLAVHHYERDLAQGNVSRKLLRGGLVGQGQALKGTAELGSADAEYDYIEKYMDSSALGLLGHDLRIMWQSLVVVLQAKGL